MYSRTVSYTHLYEYRDNVETGENTVQEVMLDLQSGNTHSYISYLKDIVDEECDQSVRAGCLLYTSEKLNTARTFAENHPEFTPNVRALEAVQPRELEASEIEVRIGATWIEPSDYQDFMRELLHTPWYLAQKEIQVKYSEVNGEWLSLIHI